jgi:glucose-1-phosphate adenylyltransferase
VPFGGTYRIVDFTLSNSINSGIRKIHVLIQYKSESLQRHVRMGWHIFHGELGEFLDVVPAQQRMGEHWYQGTADAIYQNMYSVMQEKPEHILVLSGDHIYKMDYGEMVSFHRERKADVTVGVIEFPRDQSRELGVVEVDRHDRIVSFQEKPKDPKPTPSNPDRSFVSMGIYVFNRAVLEDWLSSDAKRKDSSHDFGRDLLPSMMESVSIMAYNFKDSATGQPRYWRDIGTLDAFYEANMDLIQIEPQFNLHDPDWPIRTYHQQWPPSKTVHDHEKSHRVGFAINSLVSNGCIISGGQVRRSLLSPDVRINSFAEVEDSILMEHVDIGRYAKVRRAIIDKGVKVPRHACIGYDLDADRKRFHVTESGIVVVGKGALIPEPQQPASAKQH